MPKAKGKKKHQKKAANPESPAGTESGAGAAAAAAGPAAASPTAAPLVAHRDGKFVLCEEGCELLKSIDGPIAVLAVAGMYRTGKSFLLNQLCPTRVGFSVGDTTQSCTRGINVLIPCDTDLQCGCTLVLLDTEGMASMDQDETYDAIIFSLGLLLSSFFVLNSMGVIDEAAIDRLFLVSELTNHIQIHTKQQDDTTPAGDPKLGEFFPPMMWLLRDFVVNMQDADGNSLQPNEYLEEALKPRTGASRRAEERNCIRTAIRTLFRERHCFCLVRPAVNEEDMRKASTLKSEELRPEFQNQMRDLKQILWNTMKPKEVFGEKLTGSHLVALAGAYLNTMNDGGVVPTIKGAWEFVVESSCDKALTAAVDTYRSQIKGETEKEPLSNRADFILAHLGFLEDAQLSFGQIAIAGLVADQYKQRLQHQVMKIFAEHESFLEQRSMNLCKQVSRDVLQVIKESGQQKTKERQRQLFSVKASLLDAASLNQEVIGASIKDGFTGEMADLFRDFLLQYEQQAQGSCRFKSLVQILQSDFLVHLQDWRDNICKAHEGEMAKVQSSWTTKLVQASDDIRELQLSLRETEGNVRLAEEGKTQMQLRLEEHMQAASEKQESLQKQLDEESKRHEAAAAKSEKLLKQERNKYQETVVEWREKVTEERQRHEETKEDRANQLDEEKLRHTETERKWTERYEAQCTKHNDLKESYRQETARFDEERKEWQYKYDETNTQLQKSLRDSSDAEKQHSQVVTTWQARLEELRGRFEGTVADHDTVIHDFQAKMEEVRQAKEETVVEWKLLLAEEKARHETTVDEWSARHKQKNNEMEEYAARAESTQKSLQMKIDAIAKQLAESQEAKREESKRLIDQIQQNEARQREYHVALQEQSIASNEAIQECEAKLTAAERELKKTCEDHAIKHRLALQRISGLEEQLELEQTQLARQRKHIEDIEEGQQRFEEERARHAGLLAKGSRASHYAVTRLQTKWRRFLLWKTLVYGVQVAGVLGRIITEVEKASFYSLHVVVRRAENLQDLSSFGAMNPFVQVTILPSGDSRTTLRVYDGGTDPDFEEADAELAKDESNIGETSSHHLCFNASKHQDGASAGSVFMVVEAFHASILDQLQVGGESLIGISDPYKVPRAQGANNSDTRWFDLNTGGRVQCSMYYTSQEEEEDRLARHHNAKGLTPRKTSMLDSALKFVAGSSEDNTSNEDDWLFSGLQRSSLARSSLAVLGVDAFGAEAT